MGRGVLRRDCGRMVKFCGGRGERVEGCFLWEDGNFFLVDGSEGNYGGFGCMGILFGEAQ